MVFLLGEHFLIYKHNDVKKVGVVIMIVFSICYTILLYSCFYFIKIEVYPFLGEFTFIQYILLSVFASIMMISGTYLQKLFVGQEKQEEI